MRKKSKPVAKPGRARRRKHPELLAFSDALDQQRPMMAELYQRAEARLRNLPNSQKEEVTATQSAADASRLVHELQVYQVELEMQNAELQESRDQMEAVLEKYADLYDFAPVGYLSLDEQGRIREVNLTGAALLGVDRSTLLKRRLTPFASPTSQPVLRSLLKQVLSESGKQVCEVELRKKDGSSFWANVHCTPATLPGKSEQWCRAVISDITSLKQAEAAEQRMEALTVANRKLQQEIIRRQAVEKALKESEQHQSRLLKRSRLMHEQMRHLSHRLLQAQEDERKRISRELHDDIAQRLVGINVHLESLAHQTAIQPEKLKNEIIRTQRVVAKSVEVISDFARELRPTALDDLGLITALHSFMKEFMKQTGVRVQFVASSKIETLESIRRIVLYRVVQSALANVSQHAQASEVKVSIRQNAEKVHLEVSDNGRSFDVDQVLRARRNRRLGILGMRERVEMVGGDFRIECKPGKGTTIWVEIPFRSGPRRAQSRGLMEV